MTTAKSQAKWRDRVAQGLVEKNLLCPVCNKPCRADSSKAPYHHKCWRTTNEGKAYLRKMKQKSREN
ncbi:hypothetical protein H1P_1810026 [Hyella patelloides LEGE 07179]|uniref:Uncharacterized protein n=1 Tax=Hyella patelloides LEGE 07179 TaxID=945734 RepID=A0A563VNY6_9CYAN|nr:hypothetical protein [Hyella patelloides]VEP13087.1 hypothetical protein H1P_1810026 [Hyella patelloides LEGE 07179]